MTGEQVSGRVTEKHDFEVNVSAGVASGTLVGGASSYTCVVVGPEVAH